MLKLSIIVPVYNSEQYLVRCIESVLNQEYSNIEVLLIDDGSPDNSPRICDEYEKKDKRVCVIHQQNSGVAIARNNGLESASGDYITFVDSDDYIERDMYTSMMQIIKQYNCDVVMCDCKKEFENHSEIYTHNIRAGYYNKQQLEKEYYSHLLIMENVEYPATISNCLCVFRNKKKDEKEIIKYEPGIRYSEDLLFGAQLMRQAESFYYMKGKTGYHYNCTNINSATHMYNAEKWNDYIKLYHAAKKSFMNDEYNFENQIDKMLLFFLYNAIGDIYKEKSIDFKKKKSMIYGILRNSEVKQMFRKLQIFKLPITGKLKIVTLMYKYQIGISILIRR